TIQRSNPALADKIAIWKTPGGTVRRLTGAAPNSYFIWKFGRNKDIAEAYLKHYADHYTEAFKASTGYDHPLFANMVPKPMPILSDDPSSHPPDKLKILQTADEWCAVFGYPGPSTPAADGVANSFNNQDKIGNGGTGKMSAEDGGKWGTNEVKLIYDKWATRT